MKSKGPTKLPKNRSELLLQSEYTLREEVYEWLLDLFELLHMSDEAAALY